MIDRERYEEACRRMQSGVALEMNTDAASTNPKHLRVGINIALSDHAALFDVLRAKGLITDEEYELAIANRMEQEVKAYEQRLSERYGKQIKLGPARGIP